MNDKKKVFTVIYRTGGYLNAVWHETLIRDTYDVVQARARDIERMGYKALIKTVHELETVGLPIGYCAKCDPIDGRCTAMGECSSYWNLNGSIEIVDIYHKHHKD